MEFYIYIWQIQAGEAAKAVGYFWKCMFLEIFF